MPRIIIPLACLLVSVFGSIAHAEVTPGEILIAEMNCVACHEAGAAVKERLASRASPHLGANGLRLTPQWLRAFLSDPQAEQPGTLMPDMLHGLPPAEKSDAAETLTHYLISLQNDGPAPGVGASPATIAAGGNLYHSVGCVACHAPFAPPPNGEMKPEEMAEMAKSSVPLGNLARKFAVSDLTAFLRDPLKAHRSGRMPSMKLSDGEAQAIAVYLLREQLPAQGAGKTAGLQFDYYEKSLPELPEFDRLTPTASGIAEGFSVKHAGRKNDFALRFRGILSVAKAGKYKFYVASDDGSRLFIDEKPIVENGGIHPEQERSGEIELKAGDHTIMATYFDGGGNTAFAVRWKPPGGNKEGIPPELLSHPGAPLRPLGDFNFAVDPAKAARGKEWFDRLNCAACHQIDQPGRKGPALATIQPRQPRGCLAAKPGADLPKFEITDRQRIVIVAQLQSQQTLSAPLTADQQIKRTLTVLNCYACHQHNRRGGPQGLRRDYFATVGEVDLGDEGRIPPALDGAGAKLLPEWIKSVLVDGAAIRPYTAARMPQFGEANVSHLPALFEKSDAIPNAEPVPNVFAASAAATAEKFGRKLIGTGGLTCIACHNFAGNKSLGVPALDLATVGQRLKWDWFRRYLIDPQALRPGTRMPSFWPNGTAANRDVLGGDTQKQIAAIWAYLSRKNFTDLPDGLVQGQMELSATTEAIIYRNFIEGAGSRGIGVAYPEKANLAFDANEMRIALLWQGPFIDAAKHRTGRGDGYQNPLGRNVIKGTPGAPFAVLASRSTAWPEEGGAAAGYQFTGYRLDDKQRPTFHYRFRGINIADYPVATAGEVDPTFQRTVTMRSASPVSDLYFRAALGKKITANEDGSFAVDEKVRIHLPGSNPFIRESNGQMELLVPIKFADGEAQLDEHIIW